MVQIYRYPAYLLPLCMFYLFAIAGEAQGNEYFRKKIVARADTVTLDTLSIIESTLSVCNLNGETIPPACYRLLPDSRRIVFISTPGCNADSAFSLLVSYACIPFALDKKWQYKDPQKVKQGSTLIKDPFVYVPSKSIPNDLFQLGSLNKEGSLSRGLTFGNNQDVVVNSTMNLQLSGKLTDDLDLLLSATDDNIPVQPDGTTAQLQEFDKIFIQVSDKRQKLIAGDFFMQRPLTWYMNYNKKAQGLYYETKWHVFDRRITGTEQHKVYAAGAVSKGKFARNSFNGTEGNQGPYRLHGSENELFIVILSGTENVYIDGEPLKRGMEYDYIIDYNTAEISFTPRHLITKDKRIVVEFQYSDKQFARSVFTGGYEYEYKRPGYKERYYLHGFSEQDLKHRPLQQTLTDEDKQLLSAVGDSVHEAYIYAIDSVAFSNSEVRYRKTDSLIGNYTFQDIYVYSTDEDSAHYRLSFSFVGAGNGNYEVLNTSANGKVYQWVIPDTLTARPRGSYEPVLLLVSPKKKQMVTAGAEILNGSHTRFFAEGCLSINDVNLYSGTDKKNDQGYAGKIQAEFPLVQWKTKPTGEGHSSGIKLGMGYEYVHHNFTPVERYRPVEFERDWNRSGQVQTQDLHLLGASISLFHNKELPFTYSFQSLLEGSAYTGTMHEIKSQWQSRKIKLFLRANQLNADAVNNTGLYRRGMGELSRRFGKVQIGVKGQFEENRMKDSLDLLKSNSFLFWEWEVFSGSPDTGKISWRTSYKRRMDEGPGSNELVPVTAADNYSGSFRFRKPGSQSLAFTGTFRQLRILDSILTVHKPDESIIGRLEYELTLWKGVITSSTFFEAGSGLEQKKEFAFLEVPAGQGIYTWIDHNGNGIKELNEFEPAAFPDQATYIKIYIPTQEYIRTYYNQFAQSFTLRPALRWKKEKGLKKGLSRFSDQVSFRGDRKSTEEDLLEAYNPFLQDVEEQTLQSLNAQFRNTLWINQGSPEWAMDISWNDQRNKSLLTNGFDSRGNAWYEGNARWNLTNKWGLYLQYKDGYKSLHSDFFSTRNYKYHYYEIQPRISYQPDPAFRASLSYKYSEKLNASELGGHYAEVQNAGMEIRLNTLQKGSFTAKANYIRILYRGSSNNSVSFEFLEGLSSGNNITWGLNFQRSLSNNLQVNLSYDGRLPDGMRSIHTGSAQVRAYF